MIKIILQLFVLQVFFFTYSVTAQIKINELVSSNVTTPIDEDGDTPDWIELINTSNQSILLSDYFISDNQEDLFLYQLPDVTLNPDDLILLFASDKNRIGGQIFWETSVREGDETKFKIPSSPVTSQWILPNFDDSDWESGVFGLGYGDNDDETIIPNGTNSVFSRTLFTINDLLNLKKVLLHIDYDDGYIAYINGTEVYRENLSGESPVPYNQQTDSYTDPKLIEGEKLPPISLTEIKDILVEGENILAIQVHNYNSQSSDLTLIPFLSFGYSVQQSESRGVAYQTELTPNETNYSHTNFKLSSGGETIYITNKDSSLIDSLRYPELRSGESFGRSSFDNEYYIFTETSPGNTNSTNGFKSRSSNPELTSKGGFFENQVSISLKDQSIGDITYFTEDGSIPTQQNEVFGTGSRIINTTKTLKLRTFEANGIPSDVVVETYFIDENQNLPVVSISTHPDNLWSDEKGIYVIGTNGVTGYGFYEQGGANWNQDWEIPIHFEFYEENGSKAFSVGAGAKIYGGWSRLNPSKSLAIFFRGEYGTKSLDYKMFESKAIENFQSLILRNSGNDFSSQGHSMFRDGLMTTLVNDTEVDLQGYRPAVLYLNGEYWGIHNIREKLNEHYVASNSNAQSDNIDLIQGGGEKNYPNGFGPIHGTIENYNQLLNLINTSDLTDPEILEKVEAYIDLDNYIDYMASQIYFANRDWPGNNIKAWRSREADGKWRWILYDTDFGFGLSYGGKFDHNTLEFALEPNGPNWPNPSWSTVLFRKLVINEKFVEQFANRMADLMNINFKPDNVIAVIDSLAQNIELEIPRHMNNSTRSGYWGGSVSGWYNQIIIMKQFARQRLMFLKDFIIESTSFGVTKGIGPMQDVQINITNPEYGSVQLNRIKISENSWSGEYFTGTEIPLTAIPKAGYSFERWSGDVESTDPTISIKAGDSIVANFVESSTEPNIVINEIMYNADENEESEDWIELYNSGNASINLADWTLKDDKDDNMYTIPEGTIVGSNSYLVLVKDKAAFQEIYPNTNNILGDIGFGLSGNSDEVRLFNNEGQLVDSVMYDDEDPWPLEADGTGYSLELIDASFDNSDATNWRASSYYLGSPGAENGKSVSNSDEIIKPKQIELFQNYPNPFNPSTTISFSIPKLEQVTLKIYNVTGQLVATLVDDQIPAGKYTKKWDALGQASGVYFYRLSVGIENYSKKMILIK